MTASELHAELVAAGLNVVEEPGWKTRGNMWNVDGKPEGVMQHHTAPPNPYPIRALYRDNRIKANMATHEDGTLYLVAYNACNYSSGYGMLDVLENNVRKSIAPTHNGTKRGLKSGNRHFWNYENSHPGDGTPIPSVQLDTIVESTRVVLNHFGLNSEQVISHAEWTNRKIDPYWNGSNRTAIEQIRTRLEDDMSLDQIGKAVVDIAFDMGWVSGDRGYWYGKDNDDPELGDLRTAIRQGAAADRIKIDSDSSGGISQPDADTRYVRKGQPVVIKGAG